MSEQTAGCGCWGCRVRIPELEARLAEYDQWATRNSEALTDAATAADANQERAEQAEAERDRLREALAYLLKYAERVHGGDRTLTSEEYYIVRDYARIALKPRATDGGGER